MSFRLKDILPLLHTSPWAFAHSPSSYFFLPNPQTRGEELLLSGRSLWSSVHPQLNQTRTLHLFKPLKAHACSHGFLNRSGGDKNEQRCLHFPLPPFCLSPIFPPTSNTSLTAAGTLRIIVADMHAYVCTLITDGNMISLEEYTGPFNGC